MREPAEFHSILALRESPSVCATTALPEHRVPGDEGRQVARRRDDLVRGHCDGPALPREPAADEVEEGSNTSSISEAGSP